MLVGVEQMFSHVVTLPKCKVQLLDAAGYESWTKAKNTMKLAYRVASPAEMFSVLTKLRSLDRQRSSAGTFV